MIIHASKKASAEHLREYNKPAASKVAAVALGPEEEKLCGKILFYDAVLLCKTQETKCCIKFQFRIGILTNSHTFSFICNVRMAGAF